MQNFHTIASTRDEFLHIEKKTPNTGGTINYFHNVGLLFK